MNFKFIMYLRKMELNTHCLLTVPWCIPTGMFKRSKSTSVETKLLKSWALTEKSTRNPLGGKGRLAGKGDNLIVICEPTV
jgi:hypothetical protein